MPQTGGFSGVHQQLVFHEHSVAAAAALDVFELFEARKMHSHLELAPTGCLANVTAGEVALALVESVPVHHGTDVDLDVLQQMAGLGRDFVEAAAQDFRGEAIGCGDVVKCGADMWAGHGVVVERALVLVQQRDGVDKREVFLVIATGAGASGGETELAGKRDDDSDRFQQALGVLEEFDSLCSAALEAEAVDGSRLALQSVDALGLLAGFIHG